VKKEEEMEESMKDYAQFRPQLNSIETVRIIEH